MCDLYIYITYYILYILHVYLYIYYHYFIIIIIYLHVYMYASIYTYSGIHLSPNSADHRDGTFSRLRMMVRSPRMTASRTPRDDCHDNDNKNEKDNNDNGNDISNDIVYIYIIMIMMMMTMMMMILDRYDIFVYIYCTILYIYTYIYIDTNILINLIAIIINNGTIVRMTMIMITMINYENGGDSDKSICL